MKEKDKTPPIPVRFLHPENELFVEGKARFLAAPEEVKRNIQLQIQSGEVPSGEQVSCLAMFLSPFIVCGLVTLLMFGCFVLVELSRPSRDPSTPWTMLMLLSMGALYFGVGIIPLRHHALSYFRYVRSGNIEAIYTRFNRHSLISAQIISITPLWNVPYIHIAYRSRVQSRSGTQFVQGNYLAAQPLDLAVGDSIYVARAIGAKVIL